LASDIGSQHRNAEASARSTAPSATGSLISAVRHTIVDINRYEPQPSANTAATWGSRSRSIVATSS
jgi:hypothetical protein